MSAHEQKTFSTLQLAQALFTVNRHAKTATDPKYLYMLKKLGLKKLISEKKAKKEGLHFSPNPKNSQQRSDLLVSVADYYFHLPPQKEDFATLPHLGLLDQQYRNPPTMMSLSHAKKILVAYTGYEEEKKQDERSPYKKKYQKPVFKPLGK